MQMQLPLPGMEQDFGGVRRALLCEAHRAWLPSRAAVSRLTRMVCAIPLLAFLWRVRLLRASRATLQIHKHLQAVLPQRRCMGRTMSK